VIWRGKGGTKSKFIYPIFRPLTTGNPKEKDQYETQPDGSLEKRGRRSRKSSTNTWLVQPKTTKWPVEGSNYSEGELKTACVFRGTKASEGVAVTHLKIGTKPAELFILRFALLK